MFFLTLSNINIDFLNWELWWRTYTTQKTLLTTRSIELMGKKQFVTIALNPEYETFVVYISSFSSTLLDINVYLSHRPQIAGLIAGKAISKVFIKYTNFVDVLFPNLASELFEHTKINNHAIELVNTNGFIKLSKSFI